MSAGFGYNSWIGHAEEVTYGTAVTPPTKFNELLEESLQGKQNVISKPSLRQITQNNRVKSKKSVEGGFAIQAVYSGMERLIKHTYGSVLTTGAGPFTHTFSLTQELPVGLTIQVNRDAANVGSSFQYEGCQINKLTLKQAIEDFLTCEFDVLGEDWNTVNVATPTFSTFDGIQWSDMTVATLNGATIKLEEWEATIENSLNGDRYQLLSQVRKGFGRSGPRKISGKLMIEFESLTEYNLYKNLTGVEFVVRYVSGTKQFEFSCDNVILSGEDPNVKDAGPIKLPLSFEAFQGVTAHDESNIQIINATAGGGI